MRCAKPSICSSHIPSVRSVALHPVNANRNAVNQRERLRVFSQHRRKRAGDNFSRNRPNGIEVQPHTAPQIARNCKTTPHRPRQNRVQFAGETMRNEWLCGIAFRISSPEHLAGKRDRTGAVCQTADGPRHRIESMVRQRPAALEKICRKTRLRSIPANRSGGTVPKSSRAPSNLQLTEAS